MTCDFFSMISPGIAALKPYQPGKPIADVQRELGLSHIIKLASNENPLGPSPRVLAAIANTRDLARYPDGNGQLLKQALADYHQVDTAQLTLGNGSNDILDLVTRIFVSAGQQVIFSQYSFAVYQLVTQTVGAQAVVTTAKDWGYDLLDVQAAITEQTRLIFIANPNNPTGTWLNDKLLHRFLSNCPEHVIVVLDQAYFDYARHIADYPDGIDWLHEFPNLVITRTFSKAYGLAGLRIGYAISHPDIADLMNRVRQPFNVNTLALAAALVALEDKKYLADSVALNNTGIDRLMAGCQQLDLSYIPSLANFLCIDFKKPAAKIYAQLLSKGIIVRSLDSYQMPNHIRVSVGLPEENERFLSVLTQILQDS